MSATEADTRYDGVQVGDPPIFHFSGKLCETGNYESPGGYTCTRLDGHEGKHVANGTTQVWDVWDQES